MTDTPASRAHSDLELMQPTTECSSCLDALDEMAWAATSTFGVGRFALGVRSSSIEIDAVLRRVLRAHIVDVEAPANYSALMADGRARSFNFLYRASDPLVRTRTPSRVVRALISHLSAFADPAAAAVTAVRLDAAVLIVGGRAILVPAPLRAEIGQIETRLNVAGIQVADAPTIHLEPGSARVIVPEPALRVDAQALAEYEREHPPAGRELAPVLPGRYPIMAWAVVTGPDGIGPVGRAQSVAAVAPLVANADELGAQRTLDVVADALETIPVTGIWWLEPSGLVSQLRDLAGGT